MRARARPGCGSEGVLSGFSALTTTTTAGPDMGRIPRQLTEAEYQRYQLWWKPWIGLINGARL